MLNAIWVFMVVAAIVVGALTGHLKEVSLASTQQAKAAVELAIGLVGMMALWLGLMRVLQESGFLRLIARLLRPVTTWLFPQVPADHPAMSMMILNMTSNLLGLGNAATPFGLKAMLELNKLNRVPGTATDAMALFLAINTSNLALLPTGIIALRASLGSQSPGSIFFTTHIATACGMTVAILAAKFFAKWPMFRLNHATAGAAPAPAGAVTAAAGGSAAAGAAAAADTREAEAMLQREPAPATRWQRWSGRVLAWLILSSLVYAVVMLMQPNAAVDAAGAAAPVGLGQALRVAVSDWILVLLMGAIVVYGVTRGVKVYDAVVEGGKEGFQVALRVIPYLVAILVAVGMLRAAGVIDWLAVALAPVTNLIGMPAETLPMALLRPLSGSGAYAVVAELMSKHGPDSLIGNIASTLQGSTETTFYVLALYFGVVQVKNGRHTLLACLVAEAVAVVAAVWACRWLLG